MIFYLIGTEYARAADVVVMSVSAGTLKMGDLPIGKHDVVL
jgi:hypothetical protein